jgi:hypothetical protein
MKHALYEDPITHKFALVRLPAKFADGDTIEVRPSEYRFRNREEAIAALPELFDQNDQNDQNDARVTDEQDE